jgi:pantoate--beta-alanine ligase
MKVFTRIGPLQAFLAGQKSAGKSVGLVPTMGALHSGHTSLVEASCANGDFTVCSLFVNPTQFNDPRDLEKYPRDLPADISLLTQAGCQALFAPENSEMYRRPSQVNFDFRTLDKILEGKYRPGHFSGVALVVAKLFNIFRPHQAYFGRKDFQQFKIISIINDDLDFGVRLHCLPTIREADGLAMSSRNMRLNAGERKQAVLLYQNLSIARQALLDGEPWERVQSQASENFKAAQGVKLEYFELADIDTLATDNQKNLDHAILLVAAFVGSVRLIDNLPISETHLYPNQKLSPAALRA